MFGDNERFDTMSKKMDDDFDKTAKKMALLVIAGNIIFLGVVVAILVGFLYLIKVWFIGGI